MWLKVAVPLLAVAFVAYRGAVALEISRAKRRGDTARLEHLRAHGLGFYRFILGSAVVVVVLLSILLVLETR